MAPVAPFQPRSCCVCPLAGPGPAPLCPGRIRRWMPWTSAGAMPTPWSRAFPRPPAEHPGVDEPLSRNSQMSWCVSFRKGLLKHTIRLSLLLPCLPLVHCVKRVCPETRISTDTCFNGDSSLAQLPSRSSIYSPAGRAALPTPQPTCC